MTERKLLQGTRDTLSSARENTDAIIPTAAAAVLGIVGLYKSAKEGNIGQAVAIGSGSVAFITAAIALIKKSVPQVSRSDDK